MELSKTKALFLSQTDFVVGSFLRIAAGTTAAIVLLIFAFLISEIVDVPETIGLLSFVTSNTWNPTEGQFNLTPMIAGSLLMTMGAVALAFPFGLACAGFMNLYALGPLTTAMRRVLELLGGIPSVVYGFWGLLVLVPEINEISAPGASLLTGMLILATMILPTSALMIDASFQVVPRDLIMNVRALGLGRWEIMRMALIPRAKFGILAAMLLSAGRAIGETMAVLMVCGNIVQVPSSIFDPVRTLTANIALELGYAEGEHRAALFVSGVVLLLAIAFIIFLISIIERRVKDV